MGIIPIDTGTWLRVYRPPQERKVEPTDTSMQTPEQNYSRDNSKPQNPQNNYKINHIDVRV